MQRIALLAIALSACSSESTSGSASSAGGAAGSEATGGVQAKGGAFFADGPVLTLP